MEEKKKHIMVFIKSAQSELEQLWSKCYVGEGLRVAFLSNVGEKAEDETLDGVLESYEISIKTWTQYYEENESILNKVSKHSGAYEDISIICSRLTMLHQNMLMDFPRNWKYFLSLLSATS